MTESEAFERFVLENVVPARRYVLALTQDRELTEDVLQDALLRAWRHWDTFRAQSNRQAWFIGICRNVAFTHLRRELRRPEHRSELSPPTDQILSMETRDLLEGLELEHREVLFLIEVLGYDYASAAEILDRPIGTVRSRLNRARAELRELAVASERRGQRSA